MFIKPAPNIGREKSSFEETCSRCQPALLRVLQYFAAKTFPDHSLTHSLTNLVGRIRPTTSPRHSTLSFIRLASSAASVAPVSRLRVSTKVALGRPLPLRPCFSSHSISRWVLSSGWRKQWPASLRRLEAILWLTLGRSPYSWLFVMRNDQWTFRALRSILVYVPSRDFSSVSVRVQLSHP